MHYPNRGRSLSKLACLVFVCLLICLTVSSSWATGIKRDYHVYATDGFVTMSDGTVKYAFGFNDTGRQGEIQFPAPLIWGQMGDEIRITLTNLGFKYRPDLTDPHTIHLHGLHVVPYFDGFPESSFQIPMGESFTYKFLAHHEGTFMYHCHVEAVEHVQMGMYGPLVVYAGSSKTIYGRPYSREYILLISEFDSRWHKSLEDPSFDPPIPDFMQTDPPSGFAEWVRMNYRPDYWLINGLGFPDTIRTKTEFPLVTLSPVDGVTTAGFQNGIFVANGKAAHVGLQQSALVDANPNESVLVRFIHMGYESHPLHLHGTDMELLGSDAFPLPHTQLVKAYPSYFTGLAYRKFTVNIGSGETYDTIVRFDKTKLQKSQGLAPRPESSPFPPENGVFYSPTGPYWFPLHCHDDYHVADAGVYPSGMLTLFRVPRVTPLP